MAKYQLELATEHWYRRRHLDQLSSYIISSDISDIFSVPGAGLKWEAALFQAPPFYNLEFPGLKGRFFPWERTFPGQKDSFIHYQSEFGLDNGLNRNAGAATKLKVDHRFIHGQVFLPFPLP